LTELPGRSGISTSPRFIPVNEQLRVEHKKKPENENEDQREDEEWINEQSVWPIKHFVFECLDQSIE
jgi:hypothetical protein